MSEHCHVAFCMFITIVIIIIKLLNHPINIIIVTVIITGIIISNNKKMFASSPLNCPAPYKIFMIVYYFY